MSATQHVVGAAALHHADPETATRQASVFDVDRPTLVLGSTQAWSYDRATAAGLQGFDVVRRRSGGSGVVLLPGEFVWLDIVLPAGDPLSDSDVGAAMWWLGDVWRAVLSPEFPAASTHRGPLVRRPGSEIMCFASVGSGEVVDGDVTRPKLVGISQRRTRTWSRLQSMCHLCWRPERYGMFADDGLVPPDAARSSAAVDVDRTVIIERLNEQLARLGW